MKLREAADQLGYDQNVVHRMVEIIAKAHGICETVADIDWDEYHALDGLDAEVAEIANWIDYLSGWNLNRAIETSAPDHLLDEANAATNALGQNLIDVVDAGGCARDWYLTIREKNILGQAMLDRLEANIPALRAYRGWTH